MIALVQQLIVIKRAIPVLRDCTHNNGIDYRFESYSIVTDMCRYLVLMWVCSLPYFGWGQSNTNADSSEIDCISAALHVADSDSVRQQEVLDSVRTLLIGQWKLVRVNSGWSGSKVPNWLAELSIDKQGQCVVLVDKNWVSSFQLILSMRWGQIYFTNRQHKGAPFLHFTASDTKRFTPKHGRISLCNDYLFVSDNRADGISYTYQRVTSREPNIALLTPVACQDSLSLKHEVTRVKGTVVFKADLQAYAIDYLPDTGSSMHWIGIICNWPQAKQYLGKTIAYSGRYYGVPNNFSQPAEGISAYYLRITGFHPVE